MQLHELESENASLKKLLAEVEPDGALLRELVRGKRGWVPSRGPSMETVSEA